MTQAQAVILGSLFGVAVLTVACAAPDPHSPAIPAPAQAGVDPPLLPLPNAKGQPDSEDEIAALQAALLNHPEIQESAQWYERELGHARPLTLGAVAIVDNYGLVDWFFSGGDLVNGGHALMAKQQGRWVTVDPAVGGFDGASASALADLGVPQPLLEPLLDAFRQAGGSF